ncbi:MAG: hypothetical protein AB8G15_05400 [Saprospiraceae bacterium]
MKTPSTFLYDLVKTLSKSEKRYLKVQSGDGEKDYIQLLDALLAQQTFDEEQLIRDNKSAKFVTHLAVNKRYLYELILKSLTQFGQKTMEDKVLETIAAANVLIKKGLALAAFRELKKGKKIAITYELYELLLVLCNIEKKLLSQQQFKKRDDEQVQQIFELEMDCLTQLKSTSEYWYLAHQIAKFQTRFQKIQTEVQRQHVETLIQSPKLQDLQLATNLRSKIYFYQANAIYQFMLGNVKKAYETNSHFLDLLEAHPNFLRLYAERYLATLNNMLIDSLVIGEYETLQEGINRLVLTPQRPEFKFVKNIESRVFRQRYLLLLNWSLRQKDFEKAIAWIPQIETGLNRFGKKIEKHHRITFYYLTAYILFQNRQYDQALQWNNLILSDPKENVVKEIFYFARLFNLLIHYELGNYDLLDSLLRSTPKYLKARRTLYATEKTLFRFLGKLLNLPDKVAKQKLIANFKVELDVLFLDPTEQRVFNYLDLRLWEIGNRINS